MQKYYKKKPEWVKAWQFDGLGKTNMPEWVLALEELSETNFSMSKDLWVVVDESEQPFILEDAEFRDTYEVEGDA